MIFGGAKREVNMLSGSIVKGLLAISVPIMIMNVLQSLFSVIDMSVLKMFDTDGGYSVGAVGASSTLISLMNGLLIGCSAGANVVVARHIGRGDTEKSERAIGTAILFAFLGGCVLAVVGNVFAELFLTLMNCPPTLLPRAALYFRLYFAGSPILMVYNFCASILRSSGDSGRPMVYLTIGGIVKVIFNFIFVAGLGMTVEGVAFATLISWLLIAFLGLRALLTNDGAVKLKLSRLKIDTRELRDILAVGIPAGLQQALYSIANVIISATVNGFGPDATTGISIANTFDGILYQISVAPSYAVLSYVSQNVARGNIKRATQSVLRGMAITVCLGATFGALSAIFSAQLSSIMSSNPEVIAFSQQKMIIVSSTYFICGINEIIGASLKGMGRPIIPTTATLVFMCLLRFVWVYFIFPLVPNLTFLYLVWPIGWVLCIITEIIFLIPTIRDLQRTADSASPECVA